MSQEAVLPPGEQMEEIMMFISAVQSIQNYSKNAIDLQYTPRSKNYKRLSDNQKALIEWYPEYLNDFRNCIEQNQLFFNHVLNTLQLHSDHNLYENDSIVIENTQKLLLQINREWSKEGETERSASFHRILRELELLYKNLNNMEKSQLRILLPGCGLGRLLLEIVLLGYNCQGNEISNLMNIFSNYFLNNKINNEFTINPYIHQFSNKSNKEDQLRSTQIPDLQTFENLQKFQNSNPQINSSLLMSISTGSFIDIYGPSNLNCSKFYNVNNQETRNSNKECFDSLITCFFLDTAKNVFDYLYTIHNTLKKNGYWINFGPLHWHFENLEIFKDELIEIIQKIGFKFLKKESGIKCNYSKDSKDSSGWEYNCEFWVVQKI